MGGLVYQWGRCPTCGKMVASDPMPEGVLALVVYTPALSHSLTCRPRRQRWAPRRRPVHAPSRHPSGAPTILHHVQFGQPNWT